MDYLQHPIAVGQGILKSPKAGTQCLERISETVGLVRVQSLIKIDVFKASTDRSIEILGYLRRVFSSFRTDDVEDICEFLFSLQQEANGDANSDTRSNAARIIVSNATNFSAFFFTSARD
jgi:hypothetical protein